MLNLLAWGEDQRLYNTKNLNSMRLKEINYAWRGSIIDLCLRIISFDFIMAKKPNIQILVLVLPYVIQFDFWRMGTTYAPLKLKIDFDHKFLLHWPSKPFPTAVQFASRT